MARDHGLEELLNDYLTDTGGLSERPMFGGMAWLFNGHLLCAARDDGILIRLGKGNDQNALMRPGIEPMVSRGRVISGWVRLSSDVAVDESITGQLLSEALVFVRSLA